MSWVIEINFSFVEVYYCRGLVEFDLGNWEEVIVDYIEVLVINFNYINVYFGCGIVRLIVGNIVGIIMDVY